MKGGAKTPAKTGKNTSPAPAKKPAASTKGSVKPKGPAASKSPVTASKKPAKNAVSKKPAGQGTSRKTSTGAAPAARNCPEPAPIESLSQISDELKIAAFAAFQIADQDKSGTIDVDELHDVLKAMYPNITLPETNRVYQAVDRNRSGKITFDEFIHAVVQYRWDLDLICKQAKVTEKAKVEDSKASDETVPLTPKLFKWEIPYSQLEMGEVLGSGTFGVVYKGKWRGCAIAIKEIRGAEELSQETLDDFRHEISIMSKIRHPYIVLFMGASTRGRLAIVTEMISGGSMHDLMHGRGVRLTLRDVVRISHQTAIGMNYLHLVKPQIIHRDLKPMNILVDETSGNVKLIDFGLSCVKGSKGKLSEIVGTPIWMAPELLKGESYDEKIDQYSFALCVWEFMAGKIPFVTFSYDELVQRVAVEEERPPTHPQWDKSLLQVMTCCWAHIPSKRPAFSEIVNTLARLSEDMKKPAAKKSTPAKGKGKK